ncbi:hypothetical protein Ahy_B03g063060 isoform A [Arachis hypogaea]|uniref:Aminotransferase-like plant mobile domain-containing protein n=1 Tax=Arachis hypogaea TaxID=3818 RepID=A0A444ZW34_ARAHY|nr:hypothetical protein Ahy_B03g063060 isoform A [Arachis hypogaea]
MRTLLCCNKGLKDLIVLNDDIHIQRYVKCHIMLLFGTILFGNKSVAAVHWKFLPLLRNFAGIIQFSWESACLAHLYRSLCRATRVDCKEMDGPLTLLLTWAWICLPFLVPIFGNLRVFPIANSAPGYGRENREAEAEAIRPTQTLNPRILKTATPKYFRKLKRASAVTSTEILGLYGRI